MNHTLLPDDIDAQIARANAEIAARPRLEIEMYPTPMERIAAAIRFAVAWAIGMSVVCAVVGSATWFLYEHPGVLAWIWRI